MAAERPAEEGGKASPSRERQPQQNVRHRLRAEQRYSISRGTKGLRVSGKAKTVLDPAGHRERQRTGTRGRHRDSGCERGSVFCGGAGAASTSP